MSTTWTNGRVSLTKDLIFGVSVLAEQGRWVPLSRLSLDDLLVVHTACDHNTSNPYQGELDLLIQKAQQEADEAWGS